jgi:hypothetical protein
VQADIIKLRQIITGAEGVKRLIKQMRVRTADVGQLPRKASLSRIKVCAMPFGDGCRRMDVGA